MNRIAITQRVDVDAHGIRRDCLEHPYIEYYSSFGVLLVPVPNSCPAEQVGEYQFDGLILSGGNDVDPRLSDPNAAVSPSVAPERDRTERLLIERARALRIPIFAQCRGAQYLNVLLGGRLTKVPGHVATDHPVTFSQFRSDWLPNRSVVNSYHNFVITRNDLSPKLKPFAVAEDKTIEGYFSPEERMAGILWHPERRSPDEEINRELVSAFVRADRFWKAL